MSEYLILIYDAEKRYAAAGPELWAEVFAAHQRFAEQVVEHGGKVLDTKALQPTATATSYRGGAAAAGPFVGGEQVFCGYYRIEADDPEQAGKIAAMCPARFGGVELRPIMNTPGG